MRDAVAVVRACGERTEALCVDLASVQFAVLQVVRLRPFAAALVECFRIGIASGLRWLVTIDADVLVAPDCARGLAASAQALEDTGGWQAVGLVDDKLVGAPRRGGVRLYRCDRLPVVLPHVVDSIRPEGDLAVRFGYLRSYQVTGRHDYEQWFCDLHRKGRQHREKHASWGRHVVPRWKGSHDPDLRAALAGWEDRPLDMPEKAPL